MVAVHGGHVDISTTHLSFTPSELAAALTRRPVQIPLTSSTTWTLIPPTTVTCGSLRVCTDQEEITLRFAPGQEHHAADVERLITQVSTGQPPAVEGLNCVLVSGEFAHGDPAQLSVLRLARVRSGQIEQRCELKANDIAELTEFLGDDLMVAYNAYPLLIGISQAAQRAGVDVPQFEFLCILTLLRAQTAQADHNTSPTSPGNADAHDSAGASCQLAMSLEESLAHLASTCLGTSQPVNLRHRAQSAGLILGRAGNPGSLRPVQRDLFGADTASVPVRQHRPTRKQDSSAPVWAAVATPDEVPETNTQADSSSPLYGEHVTLTGEFSPLDKGALWNAIAQAGGQVGKNVTKKTTILVCGQWQGVTSKQKKAEQYREKGQRIEFWDQAQLLQALGLDEEPPF